MSALRLHGDPRAQRLAAVLLVMVSAVAAHQLTYLIRFEGVARAVIDGAAHDTVWAPLAGSVALTALMLAAIALREVRRLSLHAASAGVHPQGGHDPKAYIRLVARLWPGLALATSIAYAVQENIERVAAGLGVYGADALLAHGPIPLVIVLLASLIVAAVAALVRWRCQDLLARIAAARDRASRRPSRRPRRWVDARSTAATILGARGSRAPPGWVSAVP